MTLTDKNERYILSHLTLRKLIGILGILLPVACYLGGSLFRGRPVEDSISAYYHTNMQDILTGLLVAMALFLLTYKGYEKRDLLIAIFSGIAGLGIAIFPCASRTMTSAAVGVFQITPPWATYLHYGSSAIFFILLGVNSFFLFTLGNTKEWTKSKTKRNVIYRICGIIIFASLVMLLILTCVLGGDKLEATIWTFIFETVMLWAFGLSWLVKGKTLFKDKDNEPTFAKA